MAEHRITFTPQAHTSHVICGDPAAPWAMIDVDGTVTKLDLIGAKAMAETGGGLGQSIAKLVLYAADIGSQQAALQSAAPAAQQGEVAAYTPGDWFKAKDRDQLKAFFTSRLPAIREAAHSHGYAIGVHGSMRRDLDLIATPWRDGASDKDTLAHAIAEAACGITRNGSYDWEAKPLGRMATSIPCCWPEWHGEAGAGHIDLSVTPTTPPQAAQPAALPASPADMAVYNQIAAGYPGATLSAGEVTDGFPPLPEGWPARFRCDSCDGNGEVGELVSMGYFQPPGRQACPDCGGRGWSDEAPAFSGDHMREYADTHARAVLALRPSPAVEVPGAPSEIWLQINPEGHASDTGYPADHQGVTWCWHSIGGHEVRYVRADLALRQSAAPSIESEWARLSQDEGKAEREIERLRARVAELEARITELEAAPVGPGVLRVAREAIEQEKVFSHRQGYKQGYQQGKADALASVPAPAVTEGACAPGCHAWDGKECHNDMCPKPGALRWAAGGQEAAGVIDDDGGAWAYGVPGGKFAPGTQLYTRPQPTAAAGQVPECGQCGGSGVAGSIQENDGPEQICYCPCKASEEAMLAAAPQPKEGGE